MIPAMARRKGYRRFAAMMPAGSGSERNRAQPCAAETVDEPAHKRLQTSSDHDLHLVNHPFSIRLDCWNMARDRSDGAHRHWLGCGAFRS